MTAALPPTIEACEEALLKGSDVLFKAEHGAPGDHPPADLYERWLYRFERILVRYEAMWWRRELAENAPAQLDLLEQTA